MKQKPNGANSDRIVGVIIFSTSVHKLTDEKNKTNKKLLDVLQCIRAT